MGLSSEGSGRESQTPLMKNKFSHVPISTRPERRRVSKFPGTTARAQSLLGSLKTRKKADGRTSNFWKFSYGKKSSRIKEKRESLSISRLQAEPQACLRFRINVGGVCTCSAKFILILVLLGIEKVQK